jgi:putative transposase
MTKNTVIDFAKPSDFSPDPLTDLLRAGAQELLATAVRAEVSEFMAGHVHLLDDEGRQRLVRHGFLPEREVMTIARQAIVVLSRLRSGLSTHLGSLSFKGQGLLPPNDECLHLGLRNPLIYWNTSRQHSKPSPLAIHPPASMMLMP